MKSGLKKIAIGALLTLSTGVWAEVSVIAHPSNGASLDAKSVSKIFLGKSKKFPGGGAAVPIDQAEGSAARDEFHTNVTNKKSSQLKSYWSRIVFTGKGQPPKEVASDAEVMALVAKNPSMIGYVNSSSVNGSVKVILTAP
ncbi:MAG: phosphate ABC transporter substrate-binding protein [Pseudomonadales bacterium]|jgi:ABC-type phosphate transport system substrate-binding protein|nr:phosphate ABC transporter substrate-binding protein [Pseudomonadales bacterium]